MNGAGIKGPARVIGAAIAGGTASVVSGGKFANGALTGAFQAAAAEIGSGSSGDYSEGDGLTYHDSGINDPAGYFNANGDPLVADLGTDVVAGFGDTLSLGGTRWIRNHWDIGSVDYSSGGYTAGQIAGVAYGAAMGGVGGLNGGARSVFWSGEGNMERALSMGRSLESTPVGSVMNRFGSRLPGWSWKAASSIYARNASGTAIKVGLQQGRIWSTVELPILVRRGIPITTVP
ncbi:MAG: hypothetical protein IPJ33_04440 [Gammaproteobacteria bacterium]|nr:hypothetical protein [Gammaproteobacteria bacterium]